MPDHELPSFGKTKVTEGVKSSQGIDNHHLQFHSTMRQDSKAHASSSKFSANNVKLNQEKIESSKYPEEHIKGLMEVGATREEAISALDACGGDMEMAASILFSSQY